MSSDKTEFVHVHDFIYENFDKENEYARFFFYLRDINAAMEHQFSPWTKQFELYCYYKGKQYRCTGSSRLGDVWLRKDLNESKGYDTNRRVNVAECYHWTNKPDPDYKKENV